MICNNCNKDRPLTAFSLKNRNRPSHLASCKVCDSEFKKNTTRYTPSSRDKAVKKAYYQKNRAAILAKAKEKRVKEAADQAALDKLLNYVFK